MMTKADNITIYYKKGRVTFNYFTFTHVIYEPISTNN